MPFSTNEYQAAKGRIYFQADGEAGEDYLGNTPSCTLSIATETLDHFSAEAALKTKDHSEVVGIERTIKFTCDNVSLENLARWALADIADVSQSADTDIEETINDVQQGTYIQLGASSSFPTGCRDISNLVVEVGAVAKTLTTDYLVNAALGRVYIVPGGGIADGDDVTFTYDIGAKTWTEAKASNNANLSGALRYIADNPVGTNRDWYFPAVELNPEGDLVLKETEPKYAQMSFTVVVLDPSATNPNDTRKAFYLNGRPT